MESSQPVDQNESRRQQVQVGDAPPNEKRPEAIRFCQHIQLSNCDWIEGGKNILAQDVVKSSTVTERSFLLKDIMNILILIVQTL